MIPLKKTIAVDVTGGDKDKLSQRQAALSTFINTNPPHSGFAFFSCSLAEAADMLRQGTAHALVTAEDTRRIAAKTRHVGLIEGITQTPLATLVPTRSGNTVFLDMGAGTSRLPDTLVEYAQLGAAYAHVMFGRQNPTVALLANGTESGKGTEELRVTAARLEKMPGLTYVGFTEGTFILQPTEHPPPDVVVADGFTGNVALKCWEGAGKLIMENLRHTLTTGSGRTRLGGWLARNGLKQSLGRYHPDNHNGAILLGLKKVVVKSHGSAGEAGFANAIGVAVTAVKNHLVAQIEQSLQPPEILIEGSPAA